MAKKYEFKSIFSEEIQNYLNDKLSAGFKAKSYMPFLIKFDKFCQLQGIEQPVFSEENAEIWIQRLDSEAHTTHYSRINATKHFLTYLSLKNYDVYLVRDIKFKGTDFQPHIYTEEESLRYFMAVDNYYSTKNRKDAIQYPVLFRILYCCGTRINETLTIRKKDVDLNTGIILLNETKNGSQRYVVLSDELKSLLKSYANKCFYLLKDEDYIFSNINGGQINPKTVYDNHRKFLSKSDIPYLGDNAGPRIHDWRHHMAVYAFKQMIDSGLDMYVALPILSTYLGHKTIYATERYVRLTMQIFPYIEEKISAKVNQIFCYSVKDGAYDEDN